MQSKKTLEDTLAEARGFTGLVGMPISSLVEGSVVVVYLPFIKLQIHQFISLLIKMKYIGCIFYSFISL